MGNTIGSSPRPVTTTRASSASAAEAAPTTQPQAPAAAPDRMGSEAGSRIPSKIPLGPAEPITQSADEIKNMSGDELKRFTGEQVMGMNRVQFAAYEEAVTKEGGIGISALDPQASKAILRKNMMKAIMEDCKRMAEQHEKFPMAF